MFHMSFMKIEETILDKTLFQTLDWKINFIDSKICEAFSNEI